MSVAVAERSKVALLQMALELPRFPREAAVTTFVKEVSESSVPKKKKSMDGMASTVIIRNWHPMNFRNWKYRTEPTPYNSRSLWRRSRLQQSWEPSFVLKIYRLRRATV